ncbi:MAG: hypothetical protein ACE5JA_09920 [bacterium]
MAKATDEKEKIDIEEITSLRGQLNDLNRKIELAEEKKSTVKPEIYEKVKSDYEERVKKIIDELADKLDTLKAEYDRIKEQENGLKEKRSAAEDELEEVKFRFSLGEYSQEEHDRLSKEKSSGLDKLGKEIGEVEERSQLFADIVTRVEDALRPKEEPLEEAAVSEGPQTQTPLDDIAKELEEEEKVAPEKEETLLQEEPGIAEPVSVEGAPETVSEDEAGKELKCPKCDFVNMPDSWYCEKCGAELLEESEGGGG